MIQVKNWVFSNNLSFNFWMSWFFKTKNEFLIFLKFPTTFSNGILLEHFFKEKNMLYLSWMLADFFKKSFFINENIQQTILEIVYPWSIFCQNLGVPALV